MNQTFIRSALVLFISFTPCAISAAQAASVTDYYRLQPLNVQEVPPTPQELYSVSAVLPEATVPQLAAFAIDWGQLITVGEKILELVKAGAPVTNITRNWVQVLPSGVTSWSQLSGWQSPVTKVYSVTAKNLYGMTVIDLRLKVTAMYGGGLDGHGKFLTNVSIVPTSVYVMWGFRCDVWGEHGDAVNIGASSDDPVAGLGFEIHYKYGSALSSQTGAQDYFLTGNGLIEQK